MKQSPIFKLSHLVLYAKGWYKQTDNVFEDLKKILELDDYSPFGSGDIYSIIASAFQEFDCRQSELFQVMRGIHPSECWKSGYYVKQNHQWSNQKIEDLPDYDMPTAFIYYVLDSLRFIDNKKWKVKTPKYKQYPRNTNRSVKDVIEIFNRKKDEVVS
jgi:hypothetical protein